MKYFKQYKEAGAKAFEITKAEARNTLDGHWTEESLDDIFDNNREFQLFTPYANVWTMSDEGLVPMPGFYGTVGN